MALPPAHTLILLTSGTTVTWAHHALLNDDHFGLKAGLILTILLGATFTGVQAYEYAHAPFAFKGSIYGSTFFMARPADEATAAADPGPENANQWPRVKHHSSATAHIR